LANRSLFGQVVSLAVDLLPDDMLDFRLGGILCNRSILFFDLYCPYTAPLPFSKCPVESSPKGPVSLALYDLEDPSFSYLISLVFGFV
jgi:hypothetical protein